MPSAMPSTQSCVPGDRAICNHQGTCSAGGGGCECDDPLHYWPSEQCSTRHSGGELSPDDCCIPGERDYYCSYMGACDVSGDFCVCDDVAHRWSSERCQTWHETADPNPPTEGSSCPALLSDGFSSKSNVSSDIMGMSAAVFYSVLFCLLGLILLALVAVRKHVTSTDDATNRQSSIFTYAESFADDESHMQMSTMKSPYPSGKPPSTFGRASSFIRGNSLEQGYSDVSHETEHTAAFAYSNAKTEDGAFNIKSPMKSFMPDTSQDLVASDKDEFGLRSTEMSI